MTATPVPAARPLLITADPELLDQLLQLCAAAGVEPEVTADAVAARSRWAAASLVVVGADLAGVLATAPPARRAGLVLVAGPVAEQPPWRPAVQLGAERVVQLPEGEGWLGQRLAAAGTAAAEAGLVVGVVGGRGGAGASTLAAGLAVTAVRTGRCAMLVDADPLGGGIDLVLGAEDAPGVRWNDLLAARGRVEPQALRGALPVVGGVTVLSTARPEPAAVPPSAVTAVLTAAVLGHDVVVIDLPRAGDPARAAALASCQVVLLVVPAEVRAVAAAAQVAAGLGIGYEPQLVVRSGGAAAIPPDVVADSLGLPLAGVLRPEPGLVAALDRGDPPAGRGRGPLAGLARRLLALWAAPAAGAA